MTKKETALITGATSGIGYDCAVILAERGYDLFLASRNRSSLESIKAAFEPQYGVAVEIMPVDLSKTGSAQQVFDHAAQRDLEVAVLINTLGKDGSRIYVNGLELHIPAARLDKSIDPTGAGDAYRGGLFAAVLAGLPWDVAGRVAALCGAYAMEHRGTTAHHFTPAEFIARYTANFDEEYRLRYLFGERVGANA